jgi:hypothetical protein
MGKAIHTIIEEFRDLPLDDKEYVMDLILKQLLEAKRDSIARRAKTAMANLKRGKVKKGTIKDLYKDFERDERGRGFGGGV